MALDCGVVVVDGFTIVYEAAGLYEPDPAPSSGCDDVMEAGIACVAQLVQLTLKDGGGGGA